MIIKIDYREKELEKLILNYKNNNKKYENIIIKNVNLHLGDIILCDNNENEVVIIERKTLKDLASSICDGRYKDQSKRLDSYNIHNHNIYYLIEGNISNFKPFTKTRNIITSDILLSSMISITNIKGFSLYKSENVDESVKWILRMIYKLNKEKYKIYYENNEMNNINIINKSDDYVPRISKKKSDNITINNIDIIMLSQIPSISTITANALMDEYKTIYNLIKNMNDDKNALSNIKICKNNKYRKISKLNIENLYKFLIKNIGNN